MADQAKLIIRFATVDGTNSRTQWSDCEPPRAGDLATIEHQGAMWAVKLGAAVIAWESGVQVFGVSYKPLHKVEG